MASYLVVANRTLGGAELGALLRDLIATQPAPTFMVMVPVTIPLPMDVGGAMGGIAVIDFENHGYVERMARERLDALLSRLHEAGVDATGDVVTGDALAAMERACRSHQFDGIIISSLATRWARWLRMDLLHRAERKFSIPITTIEGTDADDGLDALTASIRPVASTDSPTQETPTDPETPKSKKAPVGESVYKIIELVGTSTESWEKAAAAAVSRASSTLRDLRVAEIVMLDMVIDEGKVSAYRAKIKVSFKYEDERD